MSAVEVIVVLKIRYTVNVIGLTSKLKVIKEGKYERKNPTKQPRNRGRESMKEGTSEEERKQFQETRGDSTTYSISLAGGQTSCGQEPSHRTMLNPPDIGTGDPVVAWRPPVKRHLRS